MAPTWLTVLAWGSLATGVLSAIAIVFDTYGRGRRQEMRVMEAVWPITALYLGPLEWVAYTWLGQPKVIPEAEAGEEEAPEWQGVAISATHCGAGCALGDIIGEWLVFAVSITIAGASLLPEYILDFTIAYVLGILFQYFAIRPTSETQAPRRVLIQATKADILSIVGFEAGMFTWMAVAFFVLFPPRTCSPITPRSG